MSAEWLTKLVKEVIFFLIIKKSRKLPDTEAAEPDEVGVIRPPPTAELKPMRDGLPLPGAREL